MIAPTAERVFIARTERSVDSLAERMLQALEWLNWRDRIKPGARVFIKPNLTWPTPRNGVTTTPDFVEAMIRVLLTQTSNIIVGESDGGYHSYPAEAAFRGHNFPEMERKYGVKIVNLSKGASELVRTEVSGREVEVELPSLLLHDIDAFITAPVPKVHAMTRLTMGFKNQWGCIPNTMRLRNHADFPLKIVAINRLLNPAFALYDGRWFLNENGPLAGVPVDMDLLIAASSIGAGDLVCSQIMSVDWRSVEHLRVAQRNGMFPQRPETVQTNAPPESFRKVAFRLRRSPVNWVALAAFRSHMGTRILYESPLAVPLRSIVRVIRRNPMIKRALYGRIEPPVFPVTTTEEK